LIVDGRKRWRAAKQLGMGQLPWQPVAENEVAGVILSCLIQRGHFTKSALAYLAYPLMSIAHDEAVRRRLQNLRKGQQTPEVQGVQFGKRVEDFADKIGVSCRLYLEARRVHEIFRQDPEYKAQMEPRILAQPIGGEHESKRPVGLGAVVAGWGGRGNKDKIRVDRRQLDLFEDAVCSLVIRWQKLPQDERTAALRNQVAAMPQDLREEMADALRLAASKKEVKA
jgi:hypothetical protein